MTMRDRLIEQRRNEALDTWEPKRTTVMADAEDPACTELRRALYDPAIPDEAKSLMRQSVAAMVAAWTPKEDPR